MENNNNNNNNNNSNNGNNKLAIVMVVVVVLLAVLAVMIAFVLADKKVKKDKTDEQAVTSEVDDGIASEEAIEEGESRQVELDDGTALELASNETYFSGLVYTVDKESKTATVSHPVDYEMTDLELPDEVELNGDKYKLVAVGSSALSGLDNLKTVKLGNNIEVLYEEAFYADAAIESFTCNDSLVSIGANALAYLEALKTINLNEGLETIDNEAFCGDAALTEITIPGTVASIGSDVFMDCENLKTATIKEGVSSLGTGMFCNCYGLTSVSLPSSISELPDEFLYSCESMTGTYNISDNIKRIGMDALSGTNFSEVRVPRGLIDVDENTFGGIDDLKTLSVAASEKAKYEEMYEGYDYKITSY
ncbi:MAG: leucine-rich repeat domain-containing protein [Lachnospiraceae bacterium]|nr:leucine-rich repeat domain-containing protein [Lachnospiraceae bacterium]